MPERDGRWSPAVMPAARRGLERPAAFEPPPARPPREWQRPLAYALLAAALLVALVTIVLALRLGFRLADAGRDEADFSVRDPVVLLLLGATTLGLFRLAERLGDF